jgi:hypothetical protein
VGLTDAGFYEVVVDLVGRILSAGCLYDVDILSTDGLLDLTPALADLKLGKGAVALRDTEDVADIVDERGVGVAPKDDEIADHLFSVPLAILGDTEKWTATTAVLCWTSPERCCQGERGSKDKIKIVGHRRHKSCRGHARIKQERVGREETRRDNARGKSSMHRRSKRPVAGCLRRYCHRGIIVSKSVCSMNEERELRTED